MEAFFYTCGRPTISRLTKLNIKFDKKWGQLVHTLSSSHLVDSNLFVVSKLFIVVTFDHKR
jgi:hypothetical protein